MRRTTAFHTLRLFLPDADDWSTIDWIAWGDGQPPTRRTDSLAALPAGDKVELILPARRVSMHRLTLPAQPGRHIDALIAQLMEDRLLGDKTDALTIAGPRTGTDGLVWVVSRRWLEAAMARLRSAGIEVARVLPEYALLPDERDTVTCVASGSGTIFRTPDGRFGLVPHDASIDTLVPGASQNRVADPLALPWPAGWPATLPRALERFSSRRVDLRGGIVLLKWAALCAVLVLAGDILRWRQLEAHEARLLHEIRQTFATTFPGTPVIDPVLQWESKLRENGPAGRDALDAAVALAARIDAPLHPLRVEAGDGFVRLTLSESELAQFRASLERAGKAETSPSELGAGLVRLHYRSTP